MNITQHLHFRDWKLWFFVVNGRSLILSGREHLLLSQALSCDFLSGFRDTAMEIARKDGLFVKVKSWVSLAGLDLSRSFQTPNFSISVTVMVGGPSG